MKNKFEQTLAAEAAAKAAKEAANQNQTAVQGIIDREQAHANNPKNGIFETIQLFQQGKRVNVTLKVLARAPKDGEDLSKINIVEIPLGCANSQEDAIAIVEDLRPYAPNGQLLTESDVVMALNARMRADEVAGEAFEANIIPDRKLTLDGKEFLIRGTEIWDPINGTIVLTLKSLPKLVEEDFEELVIPALREALKKPKAPKTEPAPKATAPKKRKTATPTIELRLEVTIMSVNSECNKVKGPFATLKEAQEAALKLKGKKDKFLFEYFGYEVWDITTHQLISKVEF